MATVIHPGAGMGVGTSQIAADAAKISEKLHTLSAALTNTPQKTLRPFTRSEAAAFLGVPEKRLGQTPKTLSLADINALRAKLRRPASRRPGAAPQVIAVANFKGGSAKTTTAVHLAQYFAFRGFRTLAVDLDPQASLTSFFNTAPLPETLYAAIRYEAPAPSQTLISATHIEGLDLIPGGLELHEFEHETPRALMAKTGGTPFYARVSEALSATGHDIIVIDCPPQLGFLTLGALCAATGLLITIHPQMLDVASMAQFLSMMADLMGVVERSGAPVTLDFVRYVLTRHEPSDGPQSEVAALLRNLVGPRMLQNAMVKSTAIADAGLTNETLYEVGREAFSKTTYDRAIASLSAVNGEIEGLVADVFASDTARAA